MRIYHIHHLSLYFSQEGLSAMLTPYLSKQLQNNTPHETLKLLNSNSENPYLVWNNGTRAELTQFLEEQRDSAVRRGESDPAFGAEFKFTQHTHELLGRRFRLTRAKRPVKKNVGPLKDNYIFYGTVSENVFSCNKYAIISLSTKKRKTFQFFFIIIYFFKDVY